MAQNNGHNFDASGVKGTSYTDTRIGRGGSNPLSGAANTALNDIGSMRTYLQAQQASTYTNPVLDSMTANDMAYAVRIVANGGLSNLTGIK